VSQVDIEILKLAYEAISHHGVEAAEQFAEPDVQVLDGGRRTGEAAVGSLALAELFGRYSRPFDDFRIETTELIDAGDRVAVCVRIGGRSRSSGAESWTKVFHVHTMRNGRTARIETFSDRASALSAAALRPEWMSPDAPEAARAS
jgi:ketosteroid isomerase-like protein